VSGIAGIIHFDGRPVEPGQVEAMTAAMHYRGPDGIDHWRRGNVALGQCMLRTTAESLEETQPLTNEDESLVLVMDGRVDNWEELRRELLDKEAVLRTRSDAELVLRAYETWGKHCPERIIGEFAFFIWDQRQRCLFGARDAVGTRHFYYHAGPSWFGFASEIKGLLATGLIEARLNEFRLLDYLVPEFDRDDQIATFYQGIVRLPAGHAMEVSTSGVKTWRYWNPGELEQLKFSSLDECAEAFLDQLRIAVKCRLRSDGPVGAMLSGGLDSSSIVGLIRKEFRGELAQPLKTFSLIREDRENCKDWEHIQEMLKEGWIEPSIMTSGDAAAICQPWLDNIADIDEPFAISHGLTYAMVYQAARKRGCRVVLDGMAGDVLFYGVDHSLNLALKSGMLSNVPDILRAFRRHGIERVGRTFLTRSIAALTPEAFRAKYRNLKRRYGMPDADLALLNRTNTRHWLAEKRAQAQMLGASTIRGSAQSAHARNFTSGLISFPHEVYGQIAFANGVEPRSPFSDRRLVEFAIKLPVQVKLSFPWYKFLLRKAAADALPERVAWRSDLGNHPGWKAYEMVIRNNAESIPGAAGVRQLDGILKKLIDNHSFTKLIATNKKDAGYDSGYRLFTIAMLARWLSAHP